MTDRTIQGKDAIVSTTKQKSRLGRGLSSLISISSLPIEAEASAQPPAGESVVLADDAAAKAQASRPDSVSSSTSTPASRQARPAGAASPSSDPTLHVPVEAIIPNPHQPRRAFDEAALDRLAGSIKSSGVIQPILVRAVDGKAGSYELIAGERRWRAAKIAGLAEIPAIVRDVDSYSQAQLALVENIQREDLNPIERASAYKELITKLGLTQAELAGRLGEDRSAIANYLRLLELPEPVQVLIREEKISLGHAKVLAGVSDVLEQTRLATLTAEQGLSVRNLERMIQTKSAPPAPAPAGKSAHLADLEKSLARQLGMRVQIKAGAKKGKGRLIIHYADLDQFDQLLAKMGLKAE